MLLRAMYIVGGKWQAATQDLYTVSLMQSSPCLTLSFTFSPTLQLLDAD